MGLDSLCSVLSVMVPPTPRVLLTVVINPPKSTLLIPYTETIKQLLCTNLTTQLSRKKLEILVETENRLKKLPSYIERKEWFNVKDELTRYMYETRGAVRGLATTPTQKEKADAFFQAMEATTLNATLKKQAACGKAAADTLTTLEAFVKSL